MWVFTCRIKKTNNKNMSNWPFFLFSSWHFKPGRKSYTIDLLYQDYYEAFLLLLYNILIETLG